MAINAVFTRNCRKSQQTNFSWPKASHQRHPLFTELDSDSHIRWWLMCVGSLRMSIYFVESKKQYIRKCCGHCGNKMWHTHHAFYDVCLLKMIQKKKFLLSTFHAHYFLRERAKVVNLQRKLFILCNIASKAKCYSLFTTEKIIENRKIKNSREMSRLVYEKYYQKWNCTFLRKCFYLYVKWNHMGHVQLRSLLSKKYKYRPTEDSERTQKMNIA